VKLGGRWEASQSVGVGVPKRGVRHTGNIASAPFAREKPPPPPLGQSGVWRPAFAPSPSEGPLSAGEGMGARVAKGFTWPSRS
jgi:hypothetical protein